MFTKRCRESADVFGLSWVKKMLLFTKRRQKGVVKQFCRMRRKGPGCPKTCVDCRISVGVTWTRSGLRTLWTGLEMMKERGPGVNILTLSKYYCFWVFLGALYCLVLGFWVSSKRCGLNVGISWYLVLSGSYFWGVILVVKTTSLRLHLGIIGATVRIRLGFSHCQKAKILDCA